MATLRELHAKAGNPDLSHWKAREAYSIEDAALLTAGIDPFLYLGSSNYALQKELLDNKPTNWQWALMITKGISESICIGSTNCHHVRIIREDNSYNCWTETVKQIDLTLLDSAHIDTAETKITKNEHLKWMRANGFLSKPSREIGTTVRTVKADSTKEAPLSNTEPLLLPPPKYSTPAIDCMNEVIDHFWIDYDPDGSSPPPKQTVITAWLAENGHKWGVTSNNMIAAIDIIARHPSAKTRAKKNQP
jgi:hypothetical protein